jgi:hypothetical protein
VKGGKHIHIMHFQDFCDADIAVQHDIVNRVDEDTTEVIGRDCPQLLERIHRAWSHG